MYKNKYLKYKKKYLELKNFRGSSDEILDKQTINDELYDS
jgi:hypothetical protein